MPRRGRRRKKTRTHETDAATAVAQCPKSFVVKHGKVGGNVSQLVQDMRSVMRPYTATKLKERKRAAVKDYVAVAGLFGVTHLLLFSNPETCVKLRVARLRNGPTIHFRVLSYTLAASIRKSQQYPFDVSASLRSPPILIINNFEDKAPHLKLVVLMFQKLFPPINVQTVNLRECRRVVLLHYDQDQDVIHLRHYCIRLGNHGTNNILTSILKTRLPNVSTATDISDIILGRSETEGHASDDDQSSTDTTNPLTEPKIKEIDRPNVNAIKLCEIGPRMTLRPTKVESGFGNGEILYQSLMQGKSRNVRSYAGQKKRKRKDT